MPKNFEIQKSSEPEPVNIDTPQNMSPLPETVSGMEKSIKKQQEIKKKEATESFCSRIEGFKEEFSAYEVKVGTDTFVLKLDYIQKDGRPVKEGEYGALKTSIEKGDTDLSKVGGAFSMEGKNGGVKLRYSLPATLMVSPDGIKERLVNDFSGGTADYYSKNKPASAPEVKAEKPQTENSVENGNKDRQAEEAGRTAQGMGGVVSILSGEGLTSLMVTFPKGRQLRISSTTGALWGGEETEGGRRRSLGSRSTPLEFLLPAEKDPGS